MRAELESIVAADEEARARVRLAETQRERALDEAREARDQSIAARRHAAEQALAQELESIADESARRIDALRREQQRFLATLAASGDTKLEEAATRYLRIIGALT